jgi:hypothetical protein
MTNLFRHKDLYTRPKANNKVGDHATDKLLFFNLMKILPPNKIHQKQI